MNSKVPKIQGMLYFHYIFETLFCKNKMFTFIYLHCKIYIQMHINHVVVQYHCNKSKYKTSY